MNRHRFFRILKDFWHEQFVCRLNPRQKWLADKIERTFVDSDFIIETTLFETMIFFWEKDCGEASMRYQYEYLETCAGASLPENRERYLESKKIYEDMLDCYLYAKSRDAIWEEWRKTPAKNRQVGKRGWEREEFLNSRETEILSRIVGFRKYMWT